MSWQSLQAQKEADPDAEDPERQAGSTKGAVMDYGPFQTYTISARTRTGDQYDNLTLKGVAVRLSAKPPAAACFDTELLRYAAGWTGEFLDLSKTHLTSAKGSLHALMAGEIQLSAGLRPGWDRGTNFLDPRPLRAGPLPSEWGRYKGLYRHGESVVFSYAVAGSDVLDRPGCETQAGLTVFTRTLRVERTATPLRLLVCELSLPGREATVFTGGEGQIVGLQDQAATAVALVRGKTPLGRSLDARLEVADQTRIQLALPPLAEPAVLKLIIWRGPAANLAQFSESVRAHAPPADPRELCRGGPARWPQRLTTRGRLGSGPGAYVVDSLTVPEENPWQAWMRLVALDFFADGRAAVSTWNGDVWIVSGIDGTLENLVWRRFAAGLFEPLGLRIVADQIYVCCRDQITRLHDLNGDGEADYYENFNNDAPIGPSYHAFAFELQTDGAGNFYYTRCGHRVDPKLPLNGGLIRVSRDGSRSELVATGMRAPNGLSIGPKDQITTSDNQGNWVPASRIDLVRPGGFYGFVPHARRPQPPSDYDKPICWLPVTIDNSSGSQIWVTSDRWGPCQGRLLHTSYGKGSLFLVMMEEVEGQIQGGVTQFPLKFESGIMRGRFHPLDGQLYVCGLKGWQTSGVRDGALQRVRYTGKPVHLPLELHVRPSGLEITFTGQLEAASAADEQNYALEQWNYHWSEQYGSPDLSVARPNQRGRDAVPLRSVRLSEDGRSVRLEIPDLKPVMQMRIRFRLKAADGTAIHSEIYCTINRVPNETE